MPKPCGSLGSDMSFFILLPFFFDHILQIKVSAHRDQQRQMDFLCHSIPSRRPEQDTKLPDRLMSHEQ